MKCVFCDSVAHRLAADIVHEDEFCCVFLDHKPLFPGHLLLVPRDHCGTLPEVPAGLAPHVFSMAQRLCVAVQQALEAEGSFVAINNTVSQSVPHLHIHVVPRRRKDGLKGFFWPRQPYRDDEHRRETAERIRAALRASG